MDAFIRILEITVTACAVIAVLFFVLARIFEPVFAAALRSASESFLYGRSDDIVR